MKKNFIYIIGLLVVTNIVASCTFINRSVDSSKGFFYERLIVKKPYNDYQNRRTFKGNFEQKELLLKKRERHALWEEHIKGSLNHQSPNPKSSWVQPSDGSY